MQETLIEAAGPLAEGDTLKASAQLSNVWLAHEETPVQEPVVPTPVRSLKEEFQAVAESKQEGQEPATSAKSGDNAEPAASPKAAEGGQDTKPTAAEAVDGKPKRQLSRQAIVHMFLLCVSDAAAPASKEPDLSDGAAQAPKEGSRSARLREGRVAKR